MRPVKAGRHERACAYSRSRGGLCVPPNMEAEMENPISKSKAVHVCAYTRMRYGKLEYVCEHYRSWPGQISFGF